MFTKSKSALSETSNTKSAPSTSRVSKSSRGVAKSNAASVSPVQNARISVDRSATSVTSKPTLDRRSPKISTPPDNKTSRFLKPSELQADFNLAQEDLKKAKENLALVENEKAKALDALQAAQRLAEEANEKLREALVAQKRAEESSEIEKFRAVEMEQAGIEAVQKKEEEFQKEIEAVRNQHNMDVAALLSATEELHKLKEELAKSCDAKNLALSHAEDATKLAETHAQNVEALSAELVHLTNVLDSKVEVEANENIKFVSELKLERDSLRQELEKAKNFEDKLAEKETNLDQLSVDLEAAKMAEYYASNLVEELRRRVEELFTQADQAKRLERSASESLESVMKQLEGSNDSLHEAESEIASLKEKVGLLEISIGRQKGDLDESEHLLELAKEETSEMVKKVAFLRSELEITREEKTQALNNEHLAAASIETVLAEKNKLINELENSRDAEEKTKKALESLASALHEVSSEARASKEKLLSIEVEHENYETQIEDLKLVLKASNQKNERLLDDAKQEIDALKKAIEQSRHDYQNLKVEWEQKELHLMNSVKRSEEEYSSTENEISKAVNLLRIAEEEACAAKREENRLQNSFKEAESEVISLKEVLSEIKAESVGLKMNLMDRESELKNIVLEKEELQNREATSLKKVEELSKLLEEALAKKQGEENSELTESEKDYDMLPKVVEFSEQNGTGDIKPKVETQPQEKEKPMKNNLTEVIDMVNNEPVQKATEVDNSNRKPKELDDKEKDNDESVETDLKMWESCKIEVKDFSHEGEAEQEFLEDELDSKPESGDGHDHKNGSSSTENLDNGGSSPSKERSNKKKKPLLHKFGSLLKKKGASNQK